MKKTYKIVIATVLKPIDDNRTYHKIGKSIQSLFPEILVFFIGNQPKIAIENAFYWTELKRWSFRRVFFSVFFLKKVLFIKPDTLLIAAIELLPVAVIYKILYKKVKIIYDIQENYEANIMYHQGYPSYLKNIFLLYLKAIQRISKPFIHQYWIAEKCYENELNFLKNTPCFLIENKFLYNFTKENFAKEEKFWAYVGTISESYGVYEVLRFAKLFYEQKPDFQLVIIGFAPQKTIQQHLRAFAQEHTFVTLKGIETHVPHLEIIQIMQKAVGVLLPYQINPSFASRIPTKFYECLSLQIPMLIQKNHFWEDFLSKNDFQSAFFIDFQQIDKQTIQEIQKIWQQKIFYQNYILKTEWLWENETKQLKNAINLLKNGTKEIRKV